MSNEMSRMKFYCDDHRCIECFACSVACAEAHELPTGISRRKVITLFDGIEGKEVSTSIACMHCTDAPCEKVCPVDCFYIREDGIVLHDKDKCIGCGYCLYACPFGAPQFPRDGAFGAKGAMDKCTMCAGGPLETNSEKERHFMVKTVSMKEKCLCVRQFVLPTLFLWAMQRVSQTFTVKG